MNGQLFQQATDPKQYDSSEVSWEKEAGIDSPFRLYFWEHLQAYRNAWHGQAVLDIGTGSGWLLNEIAKSGARSVTGIEPSKKNVLLGKKYYPAVPIIETDLENFQTDQTFGYFIALASFGHIADINLAFEKVYRLATPGAEVCLLVLDYDYSLIPRPEKRKVAYEEVNADEYVVRVTRDFGTVADIMRKNEVYIAAAERAGFRHSETKPLFPSEDLIKHNPRYGTLRDQAIVDLLRFKK